MFHKTLTIFVMSTLWLLAFGCDGGSDQVSDADLSDGDRSDAGHDSDTETMNDSDPEEADLEDSDIDVDDADLADGDREPVDCSGFCFGFDEPFVEVLNETSNGMYGGLFRTDVYYQPTGITHSATIGRTNPGALRIELDAYDLSDWATRPHNYRCEVWRGPWHDDSEGPGTEKWIGYSLYIHEDEWVADTEIMEAVTQIHAGDCTPAFLTGFEGNNLRFYHKVGNCGCGGEWTLTTYELATVSPGNWYDLVYQIRGASSENASEGILRIWVNGELQAELVGEQNLYNCAPYIGTIKLGVYKWDWRIDEGAPSPTAIERSASVGATNRVYYYDNFSTYVGENGFDLVDPSRPMPPDPSF